MTELAFPEAILVAVDFSPCALRALDLALSWRRGPTDVTVLHVVDSELARRAEKSGIASYDEAVRKSRARAEEELAWLKSDREPAHFDTMVVEGLPFVEIVKIANDLDCGLIVIGSHGGGPGVTELLFGSTAEKVLRAARQPVVCVP
jgi:nucleotide-binding universal stress UspA family protein